MSRVSNLLAFWANDTTPDPSLKGFRASFAPCLRVIRLPLMSAARLDPAGAFTGGFSMRVRRFVTTFLVVFLPLLATTAWAIPLPSVWRRRDPGTRVAPGNALRRSGVRGPARIRNSRVHDSSVTGPVHIQDSRVRNSRIEASGSGRVHLTRTRMRDSVIEIH
jgi:hypothetical protein